ncbi:preprotein translocase subunit SecE [Patescibacteria group bacterium]|nr:preprotein translocase subunit SecE [Patescibacteria group bacterium]
MRENHYIWSFSNFSAMLNFFYDSLDTLKKVKKPTRKEVQTFLLQVIFVIII